MKWVVRRTDNARAPALHDGVRYNHHSLAVVHLLGVVLGQEIVVRTFYGQLSMPFQRPTRRSVEPQYVFVGQELALIVLTRYQDQYTMDVSLCFSLRQIPFAVIATPLANPGTGTDVPFVSSRDLPAATPLRCPSCQAYANPVSIRPGEVVSSCPACMTDAGPDPLPFWDERSSFASWLGVARCGATSAPPSLLV